VRVVIFNWRGPASPKGGGAEHVTDVLASGLAARGHMVTWFTSRADGEPAQEVRSGYTMLRAGSEVTCRLHAAAWLVRNRDACDVIVDEVNTLPFLSPWIAGRRVVLWIHQLAREVWNAEAPAAIGWLGRLMERPMLSIYTRTPLVTGAPSSAESFGKLRSGPIRIVEYPLPRPEAMSVPARNLIGYVGRIAPSKRIDHIIRALERVRQGVPDARLSIVGAGDRAETARLRKIVAQLGLDSAVTFHGRVPMDERDALMRSFDVLALASLREGWGLVVSEAARFGVPSVVYPVAGLVDSVQDGRTGIVVPAEQPQALADGLTRVLSNRALRNELGLQAMRFLEPFTEERFVERFEQVLLERAARADSSE
jgi:glycosyltransferase involved in cell wall biosynthesis